MNKFRIIFLSIFSVNGLYCQNVGGAIKKTAIEIKDWTTPNKDLYIALKDFKFICLGEMHGTKEPAEFLTGLAKTFLANKHKVVVGFEIPESRMIKFIAHRDSAGLSETSFFSAKSRDGRASEAWFRAINDCNKLGLHFCFFDNSDENRDFEMYQKLINCYRLDTTAVVLTLTGNIHNSIVPFNGTKTMGCYLNERFGNKLCSINHIYNSGTMFNRTSDGLKVHTIEATDNIFNSSTRFESYYLPNIFNIAEYSAFFFTKTVTASLPLTK